MKARVTMALPIALAAFAPSAHADEKADCVEAHVAGQAARKEGRLRSARERFATCMRAQCPAVVKSECFELLGEVDAELATFVVDATEEGKAVTDVRTLVDGELLATATDKAIEVDPGERSVRFESASGKVVEQRMVFVRREKGRHIRIDFTPNATRPIGIVPLSPAREPSTTTRPTPTLVYLLGVVGLGGLATFGTFAVLGKQRENDLGACAPSCAHDEVNGMYQRYLVADVALGISVVAFAGASILWLTRPTIVKPTTAWRGTP